MTGAKRPVAVLLVEDDLDDAELLLRELTRGGYQPSHVRVDTREALTAALRERTFDIAISDWSMPTFSALDAIAVLHGHDSDLPCIIVSGTITDEMAVDALRAGARDFVLKDSLARLLPAIDRELREAAIRRERNRIHEQLVISDRMASVGLLAAGVAHEINNPLAAVLSNLDLASDELANGTSGPGSFANGSSPAIAAPALVEEIADARVAARRIRDIVRDLKMFSRASDDSAGPTDVHRVLDSTLRMASNETRHRARVLRRFNPVPLVDANESKLGQVFLNLIVNAAQSIPEGHVQHNEIAITTASTSDRRVVVELRDTGSGISPDVMHQLFTPFFTTKPSGVGTGLGLSICHRIVTSMGGEITVDSKLGHGTTFRVHLRAATRQAATTVPDGAIEAPTRRARILIVDDERLVANAYARAMRHAHDVTVAYGGSEALDLLHAGQRFDAILCDLMMPDMTGMDLYYAIIETVPEQVDAFIFMSGGAFTPKAREFLDVVKAPRLDKPFNQSTLQALIRDRIR